MSASDEHYQAFYCEENAYWRVCGAHSSDRTCDHALFVTNAARQVAVFEQRIAAVGEPVVWDYHVVAMDLVRGVVVDPDSRLPSPCPSALYLEASFPSLLPAYAHYAPRFRLVPRAELAATFASDRRHMRTQDGTYREPPPPWPTIGRGHTLDRYLDLDDPIAGRVLDLEGLFAVIAAGNGLGR